jgi:hypothetical protein
MAVALAGQTQDPGELLIIRLHDSEAFYLLAGFYRVYSCGIELKLFCSLKASLECANVLSTSPLW